MSIGMVTTRSQRTKYTIDLPVSSGPPRNNIQPIAQYFAELEGAEKSALLRNKLNPLHQRAIDFNWFLRRIVPLKKNGVEESLEDLFSQIPQNTLPKWIRRTYLKDRRRRSEACLTYKRRLQPFYDEIYGRNRLFDIVSDEVLGHKVIVHQNLYERYGHKRSGSIPFHAISENLIGSLYSSPQSELFTTLNHNSVYEYHRTKYLLIGPLYFVPHHCDSMLSFDKPCTHKLMNDDVRIVKLFAEDPHHSSFKVGDSITVNYHMGEHASEFNFVCVCGSANCISLNE